MVASAATAQAEPCCVAALIFNNAKEVGVALCELPSLTVSLFQYGDTATFFKTASLLHTRNPVEVLVPSTTVDSELVQTLLRQHGAHMTFTSVQRCFYNAEEGVQRLSQLKSSAEASLCIEDTDRYLCVAAANAVVLYMEHVNDMHLLPGSVRVRAEALEHYMEVSRTTARALQIIPDAACMSAAAAAPLTFMGNAAGGNGRADRQQREQVQRYGAAPKLSFLGHDLPEPPPLLQPVALVDAIPRACTVMGQRYLRRTLLQPLRDRVAVQGRHDAVEWLLCEPRRLHILRTLLRHITTLDLERLTATLTHQPRRERTGAQQQSYLESLQLLWSALPYLEQLHIQLKAYLGPLPRMPEPVHQEGVPSSMRSTLPGGEPDVAASPNDLCSTAAHPSVLHSIATALGQCRLPELATLMSTYLERSVLPSVVDHHEKSAAHYGALHGFDPGGVHIPPDVSVVAQQQHSQRKRRRLCNDDDATSSHHHRQQPSQRPTAVLLRLLRMCFLVQAPRGGELDALRTRLSLRISDITSYAVELRATYQIFSLRLEPDPVKLYCFSYMAAEEAKAQSGPFTWRYAGGSHFALYLSALREQQLQRQQVQQQEEGRHLRSSQWHLATSTEDSLRTASSFPPPELPRHTISADGAVPNSSAVDLFPSFTSDTDPTVSRQLRRRRVRCSTEDLEYRCARAQECVAEILQLQLHDVQPLVRAIQNEFLGSLQATVESVALLDTLLCFALYSLTHQCTRPVLVELRTGSTTAPRVPTVTAELSGDGEMATSSGRRATAAAGGAQVSRDKLDEYAGDASAAACVGDQGGGTVASAGMSETSSDPATPPSTAPLSSLTAYTMASSAMATATESRYASRAFLRIENALHPSATQRQPPSRVVTRAGVSARLTGVEAVGVVSSTRGSSGGLTISWGSHGGGVCVVTGPNACGKTTLLRIIGQYFTLAQAGCFVPAQHAQLFLADRLLAHMLCDELPSIAHSSFWRELMELSELTHAATAESVALLDELGRSTTTAQGFSLAWATALLLSDRRVHSVLTTHYAGLPSLARVRPTRIVAFHFRVAFEQLVARDGGRDGAAASSSREPARPRITIARFGHTLFPGPCPQRWYGLALAERLHFFEPVLAMARHTRACRSPAREAYTTEEGEA
ncbi:putative MutS domain III/MutS domain V [Leishmania utingensis]|uniref:MutS domain III/MutS domain V n=1 Tax=Leishmania utingensis TaxID=653362 RepID=A0AAW3ALS8_9TRYP